MIRRRSLIAGAVALAIGGAAGTATAQTEIQWWHAMGGALGERVVEIADNFNRSQSEYKLVPVNKGNYTETVTAGIAAFRAGGQIVSVVVALAAVAVMVIRRNSFEQLELAG